MFRIPFHRRLTALCLAVLAVLALQPAAPARADSLPVEPAPPLRLVSYNMCGDHCPMADETPREDYIEQQADGRSWNADAIFLAEVCEHQFNALQTALRPKGFNGRFVRTRTQSAGICKGYKYGMAVFVKGPVVQAVDFTMTTNIANEDIISPCVETYLQNRAVWACSVHLFWGGVTQDYDGPAVRAAEAAKLAAQAKTWHDAGFPVLLGGDFNATPLAKPLSYFYSAPLLGGLGAFHEADETDPAYFSAYGCAATETACRSGENTFVTDAKIDYVFFSSGDFRDIHGDVQPATPYSDHDLYRAAAWWPDCGLPGTPTAGVIRRDAYGRIFRYAGRPDGTVAPACEAGFGWSGMRTVARHGDFDGDGTEDLLAIDAGGSLWLYPADAAGQFSGSTRRLLGTGWQDYDVLLAPGDFTGDGRADLIARDGSGVLWLLAGTPAGGYAARVQIGTGWQIYPILLAPGDFDGDGKADLIGRDGAGILWFYAGDGTGAYAARTKIGTNWQVYDAIVGAGDVDGDGRADLIARDPSGGLWFYRGDGAAGYAPRAQIGYSYPAGELIF
ncbi:FG-GAP-like repeat-containing protein [Hamadaea tsunoensis]|uniref:FG-GAP-like repeat-containing protein n=1 Tax=Hamadaea tsunoensis TaxID=53368 RepID=UPI000421CF37|nr:FG-GAP-like repeat-containing protein [Hamadaea tsunoensis]